MERLNALKEILNKDPSDNFIRYAIALEYIGMSEREKAIEELIKLQNDDPEYLPVYYQYGKLLEEIGEFDKAEIVYKDGIKMAMNQNDIHTKTELQEALDNL